MGWWKAMLGAGCVTPLAGCNLYQLAGHNLINEPAQVVDEHNLNSRLREEARLAWREVCRQYPERSFTREFADGFQDGYADHLENGGPPRPPSVPPLKYRRSKYFTPEGSLRVKDYLCGAKYGADVAAATGFRQYLTVPVLLSDPKPEQPLHINLLPPPPDPTQEPAAGDKPTPPPTGPLPAPKPADAPPADKPPVPAPKLEPAVPPAPKLEPAKPIEAVPAPKLPPAGKPDPLPLGTEPVPKFDAKPTAPPPRPSPLKPGETGTGLPAIDLPFPDVIAPPAGIKRSAGTNAEPGRVIPASGQAPPPVDIPPLPRSAADGPPKPRPPADGPPKPRPASAEPPH